MPLSPITPLDRPSSAWQTLSSNLYSTGASGAVPVRPINAANPVESMDRLGQGAVVRTPEKPSAAQEANRDWTLPETRKEAPKEEIEIPPRPPLYQQMIDFIQSMWRASGSAIEAAQEINKTTLSERSAQQVNNDEPLTYADPKIKRNS